MGNTPHTHDKFHSFGQWNGSPCSLILSPPYTENLIGTHHLHDEQHGNLRRAYEMSFNLYFKVTKHGISGNAYGHFGGALPRMTVGGTCFRQLG